MDIELIILILEIIGTIAFASSGALVGIHKKMDIFGVIVLAITTAIGGGIIRDIVLGLKPPAAFKKPIYVEVAIVTAAILFMIIYINQEMLQSKAAQIYDSVMFLMDTVGLGIFTVVGVYAAYSNGYQTSTFLLLFVGVVTGVGGGVLRDMMAQEVPMIFVKRIYAVASMAGAYVSLIFLKNHNRLVAMIAGTLVVIIIRILAARYKWNLPRIK